MGSFYNVLIDRLPENDDVISSRSKCSSCGTELKWKDLIPLVSFIALRGRCRYCGAKLSWKYLFSELAVGGLFVLAFLLFGVSGGLLSAALCIALWSMLFVCGVMDYKSGVIADSVVLVFGVLGAVFGLLSGREILDIVLGAAAGFVFYGLIYVVARFVFKKEGFGQGDVVLMAGVGVFFDYKTVILIGFLSFYVALIFIIISLVRKRAEKQMALPFAPAMCVTAFFMSIFESQILGFFSGLLHIPL